MTIHRVLARRGFVTAQPQKWPRNSFIRFESDLPNECWKSDMTHWKLEGERHIVIINFVDDHSRAVMASVVVNAQRLKRSILRRGSDATKSTRPVVSHSDIDRSSTTSVLDVHIRQNVVILVADLDVRVIAEDGEVLSHITLDSAKDYQRKQLSTR